jgi:hypothetical protein
MVSYPPPNWGYPGPYDQGSRPVYDQGSYPVDYPPPYGYPMPPPPRPTNGFAIASLVCSLAGVLCCAVISPVGVILGVVALNQIKRSGEEGRSYALAGIIVGAVFTVIGIIVAIVYFGLIAVAVNTPTYDY